jgi:peptidoglycan/LPS O-acetylase OafA/YrhL
MLNNSHTRIDTWTGIRFLAAIWVILFHLACFEMKVDYGWMTDIIGRGELGVDLFFILSGMVISYVHQAEFVTWNIANSLRFWILRFARIYPLHFLMLIVMAILGGVEFFYSWWYAGHAPVHTPNSIQDFILSLLNIHDWETTSTLSFNFPSWSVSAEWFVYLLFPCVTPFFIRLRSYWLNIVMIVFCLTVLYLTSLLAHEPSITFTYHLGLVRVCTEFATGCCLYNILKSQKKKLPAVNLLGLITFLLIPILIMQKVHDIWIVATLTLFLYLLPQTVSWFKSIFGNRLIVFGGEISYAMYMVHGFILHVLNDIFVYYYHHKEWSLPETIGLTVLLLGLVILISILLHRYVEVPARRVIRQAMIPRGYQKGAIALRGHFRNDQ